MSILTITRTELAVPSLYDVARHLRMDTPTNDQLAELQGMLAAARGLCEHYAGTPIGGDTLEQAMPAWPCGPAFALHGKAASVVSVQYRDATGTVQSLGTDQWRLNPYTSPSTIERAPGVLCWPTLLCPAAFDNVVVRYTVDASVSPAVRAALLLTVGHLDAHRGDTTQDPPPAAQRLLDTVKVWSL